MSEFPVDWDEWRRQWRRWKADHDVDLRATSVRFEGKNFLADEVLGTWDVNGRTVELSEVTFPNLEERDPQTGRLVDRMRRAVGITYGVGADGAGAVVYTWRELERTLGIPGRRGAATS